MYMRCLDSLSMKNVNADTSVADLCTPTWEIRWSEVKGGEWLSQASFVFK